MRKQRIYKGLRVFLVFKICGSVVLFGVAGINAGGLNKTGLCGVQCVTRAYMCAYVYVCMWCLWSVTHYKARKRHLGVLDDMWLG